MKSISVQQGKGINDHYLSSPHFQRIVYSAYDMVQTKGTFASYHGHNNSLSLCYICMFYSFINCCFSSFEHFIIPLGADKTHDYKSEPLLIQTYCRQQFFQPNACSRSSAPVLLPFLKTWAAAGKDPTALFVLPLRLLTDFLPPEHFGCLVRCPAKMQTRLQQKK